MHGHEALRFALAQGSNRLAAAQQCDLGHRQDDFFLHHACEIRRRAADAEIDELRDGVELEIRQDHVGLFLHEAAPSKSRSAAFRNPSNDSSDSGFGRKVAPNASARSMTSR